MYTYIAITVIMYITMMYMLLEQSRTSWESVLMLWSCTARAGPLWDHCTLSTSDKLLTQHNTIIIHVYIRYKSRCGHSGRGRKVILGGCGLYEPCRPSTNIPWCWYSCWLLLEQDRWDLSRGRSKTGIVLCGYGDRFISATVWWVPAGARVLTQFTLNTHQRTVQEWQHLSGEDHYSHSSMINVYCALTCSSSLDPQSELCIEVVGRAVSGGGRGFLVTRGVANGVGVPKKKNK